MSSSPVPDRQATAVNRPPPVRRSCPAIVHSAQSPRPYEAFSTLHPVTTRPSSHSAAAPTCSREYGAYAEAATATAAARRACQSSLSHLRPAGTPARSPQGDAAAVRRRLAPAGSPAAARTKRTRAARRGCPVHGVDDHARRQRHRAGRQCLRATQNTATTTARMEVAYSRACTASPPARSCTPST